MRGFFRSNAFKVMMMIVVTLAAIMILSITVGDTTVTGIFKGIIAPMESAGAELTAEKRAELGFESMSRDDLEAYCADLLEENKQLQEDMVDYHTIKRQNEQYAKALEITQNSKDIQLTAASVTSRDPLDIYYGFSIDVGSADGIEVGDPVITEDGIIGIIAEVYASSSRVDSILSENVQIGATSEEFSENGVVVCDMSGAGNGYVRMKYLTGDTKITDGTVITTSGTAGGFPEGLMIGEVIYLTSAEKDISREAVIKPTADVLGASDVFVVTDFTGKSQVYGDASPEGE